jgi:uncharacterized protein (DUF1697 family)
MARYVAFLRAINVGGHHTVGMAVLRELFSGLGFSNVETFIASGNVIFESSSAADKLLEKKIEKHLESELGYSVATFVRSDKEIHAISIYKPFSSVAMKEALALNIGFLAAPLSARSIKALMTLRSAVDNFHVHGREVYWSCRGKQSESKFSNRVFERAIKGSTTFRGANTIAKLAAKLSHVRPPPSTPRT